MLRAAVFRSDPDAFCRKGNATCAIRNSRSEPILRTRTITSGITTGFGGVITPSICLILRNGAFANRSARVTVTTPAGSAMSSWRWNRPESTAFWGSVQFTSLCLSRKNITKSLNRPREGGEILLRNNQSVVPGIVAESSHAGARRDQLREGRVCPLQQNRLAPRPAAAQLCLHPVQKSSHVVRDASHSIVSKKRPYRNEGTSGFNM